MAISDISDTFETLAPYKERFCHLSRSADMIRETLREAILDSQLASGTWLREEELARYFGVSRTPVREALQVLRSEGLVEAEPNQGARVAALTTDDLLALYLVREVLDGLAIRLATTRMTPADWRQISEMLDQMDEAVANNEAQRMAELNLEFHRLLRRVAGNPYLSRFMQQVEHAVRRSGQTVFSYPGRSDNSVMEHREMVEAIRDGDWAKAEQLAIEHVRRARRLKIQMLLEGL